MLFANLNFFKKIFNFSSYYNEKSYFFKNKFLNKFTKYINKKVSTPKVFNYDFVLNKLIKYLKKRKWKVNLLKRKKLKFLKLATANKYYKTLNKIEYLSNLDDFQKDFFFFLYRYRFFFLQNFEIIKEDIQNDNDSLEEDIEQSHKGFRLFNSYIKYVTKDSKYYQTVVDIISTYKILFFYSFLLNKISHHYYFSRFLRNMFYLCENYSTKKKALKFLVRIYLGNNKSNVDFIIEQQNTHGYINNKNKILASHYTHKHISYVLIKTKTTEHIDTASVPNFFKLLVRTNYTPFLLEKLKMYIYLYLLKLNNKNAYKNRLYKLYDRSGNYSSIEDIAEYSKTVSFYKKLSDNSINASNFFFSQRELYNNIFERYVIFKNKKSRSTSKNGSKTFYKHRINKFLRRSLIYNLTNADSAPINKLLYNYKNFFKFNLYTKFTRLLFNFSSIFKKFNKNWFFNSLKNKFNNFSFFLFKNFFLYRINKKSLKFINIKNNLIKYGSDSVRPNLSYTNSVDIYLFLSKKFFLKKIKFVNFLEDNKFIISAPKFYSIHSILEFSDFRLNRSNSIIRYNYNLQFLLSVYNKIYNLFRDIITIRVMSLKKLVLAFAILFVTKDLNYFSNTIFELIMVLDRVWQKKFFYSFSVITENNWKKVCKYTGVIGLFIKASGKIGGYAGDRTRKFTIKFGKISRSIKPYKNNFFYRQALTRPGSIGITFIITYKE